MQTRSLDAATAAVRDLMAENFLDLHQPDVGTYDRLAHEIARAALRASAEAAADPATPRPERAPYPMAMKGPFPWEILAEGGVLLHPIGRDEYLFALTIRGPLVPGFLHRWAGVTDRMDLLAGAVAHLPLSQAVEAQQDEPRVSARTGPETPEAVQSGHPACQQIPVFYWREGSAEDASRP